MVRINSSRKVSQNSPNGSRTYPDFQKWAPHLNVLSFRPDRYVNFTVFHYKLQFTFGISLSKFNLIYRFRQA